MTVHGAGGNLRSDVRRRGYTVRYCGDDAVYDTRKGTQATFGRTHTMTAINLTAISTPLCGALIENLSVLLQNLCCG